MKCIICNGKMNEIITAFHSKWGDYELTLNGVTAYKCDNCDRLVFNPEEVRMIQNITAGFSEIPTEKKPDFLNVEEVADLLRLSNQTVYNMIKDGRLPAYKAGREWRFRNEDILRIVGGPDKAIGVAARGKLSENDKKFIESYLKDKVLP